MKMDFVGKMESIEDDMRRLSKVFCARPQSCLCDRADAASCTPGKDDGSRCWVECCTAVHPRLSAQSAGRCAFDDMATKINDGFLKNSREEDPRSILTDVGLRRFCTSEVYRHDSDAYGYDCMDRPVR